MNPAFGKNIEDNPETAIPQNDPASPATSAAGRIHSIDTLRGAAMVLVIYAHARIVLNPETVWGPLYQIMVIVSSIASVTFMFLSGTMISYFLFSGRPFGTVYKRYARRALLLLLGCHVTIRFLAYPTFADSVGIFEYVFLYFPITDTIAGALLIAPCIIKNTSDRLRLMIIALLLIIPPIVVVHFNPDSIVLKIIKELVFGQSHHIHNTVHVFYPLMPWLAIFLCGSFLGKELARVKTGQLTIAYLSARMKIWSPALIGVTLVLVAGYVILKRLLGNVLDIGIFETIYPERTTTLLPGFLGVLLFIIALAMTRIDLRKKFDFITRALAAFGRTSLFTYVTQYAIAWSLPAVLGLKSSLNLPLFIAATAIIMILCLSLSYAYGRIRGWIAPGYLWGSPKS